MKKIIVVAVVVAICLACCNTSAKYIGASKFKVDEKVLRAHVDYLCNVETNRSYDNIDRLNECADYIKKHFKASTLKTSEQRYKINFPHVEKNTYRNIICETPGDPASSKIVIGAHYDSCGETPGADDNASAVAVLIELVRTIGALPKAEQPKNIIFVAYTLEEPPFFGSEKMGSYKHAKSLKDAGTNLDLMISLEMLGYFTDAEDSQGYPAPILSWFYPSTGNFVAVVGDSASSDYSKLLTKTFEQRSKIPVERLSLDLAKRSTGLSDHRNYWAFDYPAFMLTDTAFYRNKNYHTKGDTPDTLSYDKMAVITKILAEFLIIQD